MTREWVSGWRGLAAGAAAFTVWAPTAHAFFPPMPVVVDKVESVSPPPASPPPGTGGTDVPPVVPPVPPPPFVPPPPPPGPPPPPPPCGCPQPLPNVVPEPATLVSAAAGLAVVAWARRKRR